MQRFKEPLSRRFRQRRMDAFVREFQPTPETRVLDIGGTPYNWTYVARPPAVTLLNLGPADDAVAASGFDYVDADARELPFPDDSFDIVFSNSLVEHLGTWDDQRRVASEARRIARALWIQTPARAFPVEPHLMTPGIHFLPSRWQRRLIRNFTVWGLIERPPREAVDGFLAEVRLLSRDEMATLFPDCELRTERFLGLPKSYIAVRR